MANDQRPVLVRPAILLFGDSLTERSLDPAGGWGAAMAHHFGRKADVVNRGFGGYNTRWALPLLDEVLAQVVVAKQRLLLATLWFGANDAALPDRSAARQHVPVAAYSANLEAMVARMRSAGVPRVVLVTPPPVHDPGRVWHQQQRMGSDAPVDPDRTNAAAGAYATAVVTLGKRLGVPVLDLHTSMQRDEGWQGLLLPDGLHFSPSGQALVGRLMIELLARSWPEELSLDQLPNQAPWWDKLADSDPEGEAWRAFIRANKPQVAGAAEKGGPEEGRRKHVRHEDGRKG